MTITDINTGDEITDAWVDAVQNDVGDAWSTYTLSLLASSVDPTKGNSTYGARYRMLNDHTVQVSVRVVVGSTFVVGSGTYRFSLPVTPADSDGFGAVGSAYILKSGGAEYIGICRITTSALFVHLPKQDGTTTSGHVIPAALLTNAVPASWATNDEFRLSITYEV